MQKHISAQTVVSMTVLFNQIKTKGYYHRYINTEKTIHIIGLDFSSESRQIARWKEEIIEKSKEPGFLG